jgi:hypothetical protein
VQGTGTVSLEAPHDFRASIDEARISPQALEMVQRFTPELPSNLNLAKGWAKGHVALTGDQYGVRWKESQGGLEAWGMEVRSDWLKAPATVFAQTSWTSDTLNISKAHVAVPGNTLSLSGTVSRDPREPGKGLDFQSSWDASVVADQLLTTVPEEKIPVLKEWKAAGRLQGQGTARGEWRPEEYRKVLAEAKGAKKPVLMKYLQAALLPTLQLDGVLHLDLSELDHTSFPGTLRNLRGDLRLRNQQAEFQNVRAEMLDSTVSLTGDVKGSPFFWSRNAATSLRVAGVVDLSHAAQAAAATPLKKRAFFDRLKPEGRIGADLSLSGPLRQPRKMAVQGTVTADAVSCRFDSSFAVGEIRKTSARVRLLADRVVIERLKGKI